MSSTEESVKNTVGGNEELTAEEWKRRYELEKNKVSLLRGQLERAEEELERWRRGVSTDEQMRDAALTPHDSVALPTLVSRKRRGRPRRDPLEPKKAKVIHVPSNDVMESKPKRQRRLPVRYADDATSLLNVAFIKAEGEDLLDDMDRVVNNEQDFPFFGQDGLSVGTVENNQQWRWNEQNQTQILQADSTTLLIGTEFTSLTRNDNLMDLSKLSFMDGDEDLDSTTLILPPSNELSNRGRIQLSNQTNNYLLNNLLDSSTSAKDNSNHALSLLPSESTKTFNVDDNQDSDDSVQAMDFVINKKSKRGRKKPKRRPTKKSRKKFQCETCTKEFSHASSVAYHRISAHGTDKKFVCTVCNRAFSHKQLLVNHSSVHSDKKKFKCTLCSAKFKNRASLYTHNKSIHGNEGFTCDQCGVQFSLKSTLKAHQRLHTGDKPFSCEFCEKRFVQRSNMVEHRRVHTGEKPYKCTVGNCTKNFTTASQLRNHKATHSETKNYLCSVCGKSFSNSENFKSHMRRHGTEKRSTESLPSKKYPDKETHETSPRVISEVISNEVDQQEDEVIAELGVIGATEQIVSENVTEFNPEEGYVHILNAEDLTNLENGTQDGQQVIYLYPEDLSSYFSCAQLVLVDGTRQQWSHEPVSNQNP